MACIISPRDINIVTLLSIGFSKISANDFRISISAFPSTGHTDTKWGDWEARNETLRKRLALITKILRNKKFNVCKTCYDTVQPEDLVSEEDFAKKSIREIIRL